MEEKPKDGGFSEDAQHIENLPDPQPILAARQALPKIFPGQSQQTWANLASKKEGPRYWRKGKLCWYDVQEVKRYLMKNPVKTKETTDDH